MMSCFQIIIHHQSTTQLTPLFVPPASKWPTARRAAEPELAGQIAALGPSHRAALRALSVPPEGRRPAVRLAQAAALALIQRLLLPGGGGAATAAAVTAGKGKGKEAVAKKVRLCACGRCSSACVV